MATAFIRTIVLYFLIMIGLRLLGKRQIGELEPIELVLTLLISDLAAVPMQDFGIPLLNGVIPIVTLLSLSMLLSWGSVRSIRLRRLICGSPTALILDGKVQQDAMRHNRFTLDELIEELRSQGVSDLTTVKYAVLETDGGLSVLLYPCLLYTSCRAPRRRQGRSYQARQAAWSRPWSSQRRSRGRPRYRAHRPTRAR